MTASIDKIKRFKKRALEAKQAIKDVPMNEWGCKETGALRRSSMDLSRVLTKLRQ